MVDCIRMRVLLAASVLAASMLAMANQVAADSCGAACRNAYNQCRIATKGAASCESAFTSCMQGCRSK